LKTAVYLYNNEQTAKPVIKILNNIGNYSPVRNMMAHDFFAPTDDRKAVHFYSIKAKGRLDISKDDWEPKHFDAAYRKVRMLQIILKSYRSAFHKPKSVGMGFFSSPAFQNALASSLPAGPMTAGLLSPQPVSDRGSRLASRQKATRKPRKKKAK
jgi:hypothetical protein